MQQTQQDDSFEQLLTRKEAAAYLGVKPNTLSVWDCTKRYDLRPIKIGSRLVRYKRCELDAFLERWQPTRPC